ncbi:TIGR04255 family protein [Agrobacterium tumefaciens]|uniref:TIGR04255 family protein n=1 Tax=Agrobacterium tumefaciens TaxID=358 RepID=UPI0013AFDF80|nr:TIGR04255 family protein [Agrobacterium tumefaciens]
MWKIFNETNAVEGMALTIRFNESVNSRISRRVINELELAARQEGFIDKQPLQQFQIDVNTQLVRQTTSNGIALQHTSVKRNHFGVVEPTLIRQVVFQPEQLILQVHHYRSWEKERESALKIFGPVLGLISSAVQIHSLRLEYLNRFVFDGDDNNALATDILKSSELVAGLSLTSSDLWHSHSGRFDDHDGISRRLTQVNADMQALSANHPLQGRRTLALMLAVERQFSGSGMEAEEEDILPKVDEHFISLHDSIHILFKQIIDSDFASANGLPA